MRIYTGATTPQSVDAGEGFKPCNAALFWSGAFLVPEPTINRAEIKLSKGSSFPLSPDNLRGDLPVEIAKLPSW